MSDRRIEKPSPQRRQTTRKEFKVLILSERFSSVRDKSPHTPLY